MHGGDSVVGVLLILRTRIRCASCERVSIQAVIFQMDVYIGVEEVASSLRKKKEKIFFFANIRSVAVGLRLRCRAPHRVPLRFPIGDLISGGSAVGRCGYGMWDPSAENTTRGTADATVLGFWRLRGWVL